MVAIDVSRYANTMNLNLKVKVLTPMFLGGSDGNAELRPAPFKAALRYWWRVTQDQSLWRDLLQKEQRLFGGTFHDSDLNIKPLKSKVNVSVSGNVDIDHGKTNFETNKKIIHPEVTDRQGNPRSINCLVYLGMGPIFWNKENRRIEYNKSRIKVESEFKLRIAYNSNNSDIIKAISLLHHLGGVGARNRNSWGSISLYPQNNADCLINFYDLITDSNIKISFDESFKYAYPTGIPFDSKNSPLIWETIKKDNVFDVMHELAKKYVEMRTKFQFTSGIVDKPEKRHLLGYPVTNHKVKKWEPSNETTNNLSNPKRMKGRMPSQLRFKIVQNEKNEYFGRIIHLCHKLPKPTFRSLDDEKLIWQQVHKFLDYNMQRVKL